MNNITHERLKEALRYDPKTGVFTWRISPANNVKVGSVAGTILRSGYRQIRLDGKLYYAHRLAYFYVHAKWPQNDVDHRGVYWYPKTCRWMVSIKVNYRSIHVGYFKELDDAIAARDIARREHHHKFSNAQGGIT